jgi:hypothetical protein
MSISQEFYEKRLDREHDCGKGIFDAANNTLYIENIPLLAQTGKKMLQFTGLYDQGKANSLAVRIRHETWYFKELPEEFDDFRILHISDLHIDALPELAEILPVLIAGAKSDLVVFTGDYRFDIHHSDKKIDHLLKGIIEQANKAPYGALGILGNHDYLQYTIDNVGKMGLELLINESIKIKRKNSRITLIGLDDIHYYRTGRLFDFREELRKPGFKLLLIHSPELYREAALAGVSFYLCGHTHGGQICLPGGLPILSNCRAPQEFTQGRWHYKNLWGYTSNGAGSSGLPLRWNCPPEITVHRLRVKK